MVQCNAASWYIIGLSFFTRALVESPFAWPVVDRALWRTCSHESNVLVADRTFVAVSESIFCFDAFQVVLLLKMIVEAFYPFVKRLALWGVICSTPTIVARQLLPRAFYLDYMTISIVDGLMIDRMAS